MKKLILIIVALLLVSCTQNGYTGETIPNNYPDTVTILNDNGDVIKVYENVKASTVVHSEKVYVDTKEGENICIVGGVVIINFGNGYR